MPKLSYRDIISAGSGQTIRGTFELSDDEGIVWTPSQDSGSKTVRIGKNLASRLMWAPCGAYAMLHVYTNGVSGDNVGNESDKRTYYRFDGFRRRDAESIREVLKDAFGLELEVEVLAANSLNVGDVEIDKSRRTVRFEYEEKTVFEVPLGRVSQCVAPGKGDIEMHFEEDDTGTREDELLVEIKFRAAPGDDDEDVSEKLQKKLISAAGIERVTGDMFCSFDETIGNFMAPRGKFEVQMYEKYFRLLGKTYEYKIMYRSVNRMFLLEKSDSNHMYFDIVLDDPITQGQQRHKHLVMQVEQRDDQVELQISEEDIKEKYDDKIETVMSGRLPDTVAKLFKVLTGKKVFVAGSFKSHYEQQAIKCIFKGSNGQLYPMARNLLYLHKPATLVRYADIDYVEFHRIHGSQGVASRSFDMEVNIRPVGKEGKETLLFQGVDKAEYKNLFAFLNQKVKVRTPKHTAEVSDDDGEEDKRGDFGSEDESDDADFGSDDEHPDSGSESGSSVSLASDDGFGDNKMKSGDGSDSDGGDDNAEDGEKKKKKRKKRTESEMSTPKKEKRKPKRDPLAPKGLSTAFIFFQASRRDAIKAADPEISFGELSKKLGAEWKELSEEGKAPFIQKASEDKERYDKEMEEYTPAEGYAPDGSLITEATEARRKAKEDKVRVKKEKSMEKKLPKRDPNAPQPPVGSYLLFSTERRAALTEGKEGDDKLTFGDMAKQIGAEWKDMSEETKKKYVDQAAKDKERYDKEMESYTPPEGYDAHGRKINKEKEKAKLDKEREKKEEKAAKRQRREEKAKKKKRDPNAPKPAATAYTLFSAERREKIKEANPEITFGELSKQVGTEWGQLAADKKQKFLDLAAKDKERYTKQMASYKPPVKTEIKEEPDAGDSDKNDNSSVSNSDSSDDSGSGSDDSDSEDEDKPPKKKSKK